MVFHVLSENNVHLMSKKTAGGHMSEMHVHSTVSLEHHSLSSLEFYKTVCTHRSISRCTQLLNTVEPLVATTSLLHSRFQNTRICLQIILKVTNTTSPLPSQWEVTDFFLDIDFSCE